MGKKAEKKAEKKAARKAEAKALRKAEEKKARKAEKKAEAVKAEAAAAQAAEVEADAAAAIEAEQAEAAQLVEAEAPVSPPARKPVLFQKDYGRQPYVVNVEKATLANKHFRKTIWTGEHLQLTYMTIPPGGDIGLEVHPDTDQFLRVEQGTGRVQMGPAEDELTYTRRVTGDFVVLVPAGTWHNITNTGRDDLKLYTLYGPPDHVAGTVHRTQADAETDPNEEH
ncbi:cupin domain-containing protein [Propioniciclava soli]|uniref:cupin domain-containing protein n=1 Tax=Propioniciclava soli TaxID=2775081 RepID=UPI001E5F4A41|nr:cupin domain-containing protein [Propioniciclava soli]